MKIQVGQMFARDCGDYYDISVVMSVKEGKVRFSQTYKTWSIAEVEKALSDGSMIIPSAEQIAEAEDNDGVIAK